MDFYFSGFDRKSKAHVLGRLATNDVFDLNSSPSMIILGETDHGIRDMQSVTDLPNLSFSDNSLDKPRHSKIETKTPKIKAKSIQL